MLKIISKILSPFSIFFRLIEDENEINVIKGIEKDRDGNSLVIVSPIGKDKHYSFYPHKILGSPQLRELFLAQDLKLIKAILITEGDIFITHKEFKSNHEIYSLTSHLDNSRWELSREDIFKNNELMLRINRRFSRDLSNLNGRTQVDFQTC